jgi:hypothetical protein
MIFLRISRNFLRLWTVLQRNLDNFYYKPVPNSHLCPYSGGRARRRRCGAGPGQHVAGEGDWAHPQLIGGGGGVGASSGERAAAAGGNTRGGGGSGEACGDASQCAAREAQVVSKGGLDVLGRRRARAGKDFTGGGGDGTVVARGGARRGTG